MARRGIEVDGHGYRVVENMGFDHSAEHYACVVADADGDERVAVRRGRSGPWRFWTARDRVSGLVRGKVTGKVATHESAALPAILKARARERLDRLRKQKKALAA